MINTVITPMVDEDTDELVGFDLNEELADKVVQSMAKNNTFVPNIDRVIFATNTRGERPVLATVVHFKDGTKSVVKNCIKDDISVVDEKVKLSDGSETTVKTAGAESKEIGLAYAILKRIVCEFDENGNVRNAGFSKFLHNAVGNATCSEIVEARAFAEKRISKAKKNQTEKTEKPVKEKESLRDTVRNLSNVVEGLGGIVQKLLGKNSYDKEENSNA